MPPLRLSSHARITKACHKSAIQCCQQFLAWHSKFPYKHQACLTLSINLSLIFLHACTVPVRRGLASDTFDYKRDTHCI